MRVSLVDVDSRIVNLALAKLARYYRNDGHEVELNLHNEVKHIRPPRPDIIAVSVVFNRNKRVARNYKLYHGDTSVIVGGSAVSLEKTLGDDIEHLKPDYSIYDGKVCTNCGRTVKYCKCKADPVAGPVDYSIGYSTRGCRRDCYFCIVPEKEGDFRRYHHPRKFHNEDHDKIIFLDNNILFDKEWFMEVTDYVLESSLRVDFNQGLDIRLIDEEIAERLTELNRIRDRSWKFAFDKLEEEENVREGIAILREAGVDLRQRVLFYVYLHNEDYIESAKKRCYILREEGTNPYVMFNIDREKTQKIQDLIRWANNKWLFNKIDFDEYDNTYYAEARERTSAPLEDFTPYG